MEPAAWVRCPACRTVNAKPTLPCLGCGGSLAGAPPGRAGRVPEIERQIHGDRRRSNALLVVLACFGGMGVLMILKNMVLFSTHRAAGVVAFVVLAALGGLLLARRNDPAFEAAGRIVLRGLAVIGALVLAGIAVVAALVIYLFVACATGNLRIAG
jgi:hypothetical protein